MQKIEEPTFFELSSIWACGSGGSGIFGGHELEDKDKFTGLTLKLKARGIVAACTGGKKVIVLTNDGIAIEWGEVESDGKVLVADKIRKVSCGWAHSLFLTETEKVYGLGENKFGQIGIKGDDDIRSKSLVYVPRELVDLKFAKEFSICDIFCGFRQSFFVIKGTEEGRRIIFSCGYNKFCELGIEGCETIKYPVPNEEFNKVSYKVKKIQTGHKFTCFLEESGKFFGVGDNKFGQLGDKYDNKLSEIASEIVDFSLGWNHTLILKENGQLWTAGRGNFGQQGLGDLKNQSAFTEVGFFKSHEIKHFAAGSESNHCLTDKGLYSWGWNEHGNLGIGGRENRDSPVKADFSIYPDIKQILAAGAVCFLLK